MPFDAASFEIDPLALTTPRARLEYLRDFLRKLPSERFNMNRFYSRADDGYVASSDELAHDCGTAGCIAGWAITLFNGAPIPHIDGRLLEAAAARLLGVVQSHDLFFPNPEDWDAIKPQEAAAVLDHLIRTGEVDWSVAPREPGEQ